MKVTALKKISQTIRDPNSILLIAPHICVLLAVPVYNQRVQLSNLERFMNLSYLFS
jgi:hypothetical protein